MATINPFDPFVADTDAVAAEFNTKLETLRAGHNDQESRMNTLETEVREETKGGTGQSSYTQGDLLYASGASSLAKLGVGTSGQVMTSNGTTPQWSAVVYVPVGSIFCFPVSTPPDGYLECDGSSLSTTEYADLFGILGYAYGGSGSTFNLPDLRGQFVRGWDNTAGIDPDSATRTDRGDGTAGDVVGSKQADGIKAHTHAACNSNTTHGGHDTGFNATTGGTIGTSGSTGGNETRPTNVALMYVIKH